MTVARAFAALLLVAGCALTAPAQAPKDKGKAPPGSKPVDVSDWVKKTSGLKAEDQVAAFRDKMKELNPKLDASDAALRIEVKNGVVTSATIPAYAATTVAPVAVFRDLEKLTVSGRPGYHSKVSDVSALRGMTRLRELNLAATAVADLAPLAELPIEKLYLSGTEVESLAPLKKMPLKEVELPTGVEAEELEVLKGKPMTYFSNHGKGPDQKQFEQLFAAAKLEVFRVSTHTITSLEPLRGMPLRSVILGDAAGLSDFPKKKGGAKPPPALGPLSGCDTLRFLSVGKADIEDIAPLAGKPLDHLAIADAPNLRDLTPIAGAETVSYLSVYRTGVSDLSPVKGMKALGTLYVGELKLKSLKPLADLRVLKSLDLRKSAVGDRDYAPLAKLPLTSLWIDLDQTTRPVVDRIKTLELLNGKPLK